MRIWFDTEFMEDGRTIELVSLGAVREDGATFYAQNSDADLSKANDFVREHVLPKLHSLFRPRIDIARDFAEFVGHKPELWAYYGAYDWVALCQLYGRMVDLPKGFPFYCRDLKQLLDSKGNPRVPKLPADKEHHALNDAIWTRDAWLRVMEAA